MEKHKLLEMKQLSKEVVALIENFNLNEKENIELLELKLEKLKHHISGINLDMATKKVM